MSWYNKDRTKWPPFCRRLFQMHFRVRKCIVENNSVLVQVMAPTRRQATTWTMMTEFSSVTKPYYHMRHYGDVIMGVIASQITSVMVVYSTVYSNADQRKHQRSASLAFVRGIHRGPLNSPHKWPVTQKMFPFDDVIMIYGHVNKNKHTSCMIKIYTIKDVVQEQQPAFNALNPEQNGRHFVDDISNACSCIKITIFWLKFVPKVQLAISRSLIPSGVT